MPDSVLPPGIESQLHASLTRAKEIGLLGPGAIQDHINHALLYAVAATTPAVCAVDLGSGAGLPGLVLASIWPQSQWTLVDAAIRRVNFLRTEIANLNLQSRVRALQVRAEELARQREFRHQFDLVTARSFGPPAVTAECATGFLVAGGSLLVAEPPTQADRWPTDGIAKLGMKFVGRQQGIAILEQVALCSEDFPRRTGVPDRKPLF